MAKATTNPGTSNAQKDDFHLRAPQISLPKGGGAVRGIGEKFSVNPVTGTGSLTVPIAASPGRNGFGPHLELAYDSGNGNGPFGIGWHLSTPAITRKTDKGLPKYHDAEESDAFILSGAEDLVPAFKRNPDGSWARNPKGGYIFDEEERAGYRVKRYLPRIEGLFARIERWTRLSDGDVHWRSISKENELTVYGGTIESRIADPDDPTRVFSWLVCQSYDDLGNAISYGYKAENADSVLRLQPNERNRKRGAARYLKHIRYGNRTPFLVDPKLPSFRGVHDPSPDLSGADWMFQVVFDYGEGRYQEELPDADGRVFASATIAPPVGSVWPVRQDPISNFRSCFEVRQYRLCRRILLFHHFPSELGVDECLVRSTDLEYSEKSFGSFLSAVRQSGYVRVPGKSRPYLKSSLPALEFDYTPSPIEDLTYQGFDVRDVDRESLESAPAGFSAPSYRFVDLDGEGISGILSEQDGAWYYKSNLGEGRFGPAERPPRLPSLAPAKGGAQLLDLAGDGRLDLANFAVPTPGYFGRDDDFGWEVFRTFRELPNVDWSDPNLRFVDLTGDGHADVLITEHAVYSTWYESLAEEGFAGGTRVCGPLDEEQGPRFVFADGTQTIYLADMSGDGLSDLVRVRNGSVDYWPNMGYGRFGPKVAMDNAPWFDDSTTFDERRIHLNDTDGSGVADVIYVGRDGVRIYLNEHGNGLSEPRTISRIPLTENPASVFVSDLLGRGTACLVWSSALPADAGQPARYLDLMGGVKPHLLVGMRNNLGAETRIEYATSTRFYLADKAARTPWVTRLAFPVHVVARVETLDLISGNRFSATYTYHHGYFDGLEREFRGFGRVDQTDTEEFGVLAPATNQDKAFHVPPVLTKTWYHVGAYLEDGRITHQFAHEYFGDAGTGALLPDTVLPPGLNFDEAREAARSLKGSILRQEVYAVDKTPAAGLPYSVSERNYTIVPKQPLGPNRHSVYLSHARETIDFHYERKLFPVLGGQVVTTGVAATNPPGLSWLPDPRISHHLVLAVDEYGNVLQEATVGYGRRYLDSDPLLLDSDRRKQSQLLATLTESTYTNPVQLPDAWRTPLPATTSVFELLKVKPAAALFNFAELSNFVGGLEDGSKDIPNEDVFASGATGAGPYRRPLGRTRVRYRANNLGQVLVDGALQALALQGETYKLAFTAGLIGQVYKRSTETLIPNPSQVMPAILGKTDCGGYTDLDGDGSWWMGSGRTFYHPDPTSGAAGELAEAVAHFFAPRRFRDDFGNDTTVDYEHDLFPVRTADPLGNVAGAVYDYRALQPKQLTDPNLNRSFAAFDAQGLTVASAVQGKLSESLGDTVTTLDWSLLNPSLAQLQAFAADPSSAKAGLLLDASTRVVYDLDRFARCQEPPFAATLVRETHVTDPVPATGLRVHCTFIHSDGFGRELQTKIPAEPGPAPTRAANVALPSGDIAPGALNLVGNTPVPGPANPRWVGKGRTVYNNKGKPVKQYEPFFSSTHLYESEPELTDTGVTPILFYDPLERTVATLHPDHSYEKVVFDPWRQETWDGNDNCAQSDPKNDPDVGDFFKLLPNADYIPSWYDARSTSPDARIVDSAAKAFAHAGTPSLSYFDSLGRAVMTVADNGTQKLCARMTLDVEGHQREVRDAKNRLVMRYDYDAFGNQISQASMEAGRRWTLNDAMGKAIRGWDSRSHAFRTEYDVLRRPTKSYVVGGAIATEICFEAFLYGETAGNGLTPAQAQQANLLTRPYKHFDTAGIATNVAFDFKGNPVRASRKLVSDYKSVPDWDQLPALDAESFLSHTAYDAMNRPIQLVVPHSDAPGAGINVVQPAYNEANLLETVSLWLGQAIEPSGLLNPATADEQTVKHLDYNEKGQRTRIDYGNGVSTVYRYEAETFRLVEMKTIGNVTSGGFLGLGASTTSAIFQDLTYVYDPVGNITSIRDDAQQTIYFRGQIAQPENSYTYDPTYRLTQATGREHIGQAATPQTTWDDRFRVRIPAPTDVIAMRPYTEQYGYDEVGNFLQYIHQAAGGNWTRSYAYNEPSLLEPGKVSNRVSNTQLAGVVDAYTYDRHGNVTSMPHLSRMDWDFKDRLSVTASQAVNTGGTTETTYYVYDGSGERVRKVTERQNGTRKEDRIHLGGFDLYRTYLGNGSSITLARETLHVMDDKQRIALVETRTVGNDGSPKQLMRYQLGNHLGSASVELDGKAILISYEEYYPCGSTSFQAISKGFKGASKRYRYTGKERDEENGFTYHGARYYAPWLGRWTACDPKYLADGPSLYCYCRNNPIRLNDPSGSAAVSPRDVHIGSNEALRGLWEMASNMVLSPGEAKKAASFAEHAALFGKSNAKFKDMIDRAFAAVGKGSNTERGSATYIARKTYSQIRSEFGKLAEHVGIDIKGLEVHHINKLSEMHDLAINPENLGIADAAQHRGLHRRIDQGYMEGIRAEGMATAETVKGASELAHGGEAALKGASTAAKDATLLAGEEAARAGNKVALKEGAKVAGTKVAKFLPFVGVVVAIGLVAKDVHAGEYKDAALDAAEGVPVLGDAVGAIHLAAVATPALGIDAVAAEHGLKAQEFAKSHGAGETSAFVLGAAATVASSLTVAPFEALRRKAAGWLH